MLRIFRRACADMKRVSLASWQQLQASCGGGPELDASRICLRCLRETWQASAASDAAGQQRGAILRALDERGDLAEPIGEDYYVSKTWLA